MHNKCGRLSFDFVVGISRVESGEYRIVGSAPYTTRSVNGTVYFKPLGGQILDGLDREVGGNAELPRTPVSPYPRLFVYRGVRRLTVALLNPRIP